MTSQEHWGGMRGEGRSRGAAATGLYGIIALKLGKSFLLFGITLGIYSLLGEDLRSAFERFLLWVRLDPEHQFFADLGAKLQALTPSSVRWFASGTLLYGLLLLVESLGMMFRVFWAAWLAIGETAFFIPIEIYHLMGNFSLGVFIILIVNLAVVWYLVKNRNRLFHHTSLAASPSAAPGETGRSA
jgi:uncharacterized membrane protein (DUF2068 family)